MPKHIIGGVLQSKIAPKELRCSGCGGTVERGRVYTKTNYGRYCSSCADELESAMEAVAPALG